MTDYLESLLGKTYPLKKPRHCDGFNNDDDCDECYKDFSDDDCDEYYEDIDDYFHKKRRVNEFKIVCTGENCGGIGLKTANKSCKAYPYYTGLPNPFSLTDYILVYKEVEEEPDIAVLWFHSKTGTTYDNPYPSFDTFYGFRYDTKEKFIEAGLNKFCNMEISNVTTDMFTHRCIKYCAWTIQRYWRRHYRKINSKATIIQKCWKNYFTKKQVSK